MTFQDQFLSYLSLLGLQMASTVPLLMALTAALLARGWLTALVFGLIAYAVTVVLQPAVLGLVMGSPELGLFNLVALRRGGITPQLFATTTQFVVMTLLIYWAVRRRRISAAE
jgi:hypothetical protein